MSFRILICMLGILSPTVFSKDLRIIGGSDANIRDYPYVASLRFVEDNEHFCGGAIVSKRHILTAAHCFHEVPDDVGQLRVYLGSTFLTQEVGTWFQIQTVYIHPRFNGMRTESESLLYDIAVVKVP